MLSEWDDTPWAGSVGKAIIPAPPKWTRAYSHGAPPMHQRDITLATPFDYLPPLETQLSNIMNYRNSRFYVSIREALSVPAIFGAVNMLSNIVGSMSMNAFRGQVQIPPDDRPRLIIRPDPFTIPREFYRATTYNIATRGEADWWIAARDGDGLALSLINMPPQEVTIEENPRDLRYPIIRWRDRVIPNEDFRQIVYSREPGELRGVGPLQMCGAAIAVAVESQIWAANFFSGGGVPPIWVKTNLDLSGDDARAATDNDDALPDWVGAGSGDGISEAERFKQQWMAADPNTPRITGDSVEDIKELSTNTEAAQMLGSRQFQNSEVATMFGMDAALLNAALSGSSIVYQNIGQRFDGLIRQCVRPNYLEGIEQTMSDLIARPLTARFNDKALTLADIKTRFDTYAIGIEAGIIGPEYAQSAEGITPGDVENAAVPFSPPQAVPGPSEFRSQPVEVRCPNMVSKRRSGVVRIAPCGKLLSTDGSRPSWCGRCRQSIEWAVA